MSGSGSAKSDLDLNARAALGHVDALRELRTVFLSSPTLVSLVEKDPEISPATVESSWYMYHRPPLLFVHFS